MEAQISAVDVGQGVIVVEADCVVMEGVVELLRIAVGAMVVPAVGNGGSRDGILELAMLKPPGVEVDATED